MTKKKKRGNMVANLVALELVLLYISANNGNLKHVERSVISMGKKVLVCFG